MKLRNILFVSSAVLALTACEDYTEHNFGTDSELFSPTETSSYVLSLGKTDYMMIAADLGNEQKAIELGTDSLGQVDSTYYHALKLVGVDKCFNTMTPAALYLPAYIQEKLPYATDGATVTVTVKETTEPYVPYPVYVRLTGAMSRGAYLLVADGADCTLQGDALSRRDDNYINTDEALENALLTIVPEGDHFLIRNSEDACLSVEDGNDEPYWCDDLGDLDEGAQAQWSIEEQAEGGYLFTNLYSGDVLCWNTQEARAVMASAIGEGLAVLAPYTLVTENPNTGVPKESIVKTNYLFTKKEGVWQAKDSFLDLPLTGTSSTDAATIKELTGFNLVIVDMPSTLTYVWKLDGLYGLRASAYANSTYNVTDAWAVSPSIDLSSAVAPCVLQFDQTQKYAGDCTQELTVWITADEIDETSEMDPEAYNWQQLVIETYPDGSSWDFMTTVLDISDYVGEANVHVAFRYVSTSTAAATWEVKNLVVKMVK